MSFSDPDPAGEFVTVPLVEPLTLDSGAVLDGVEIACARYGRLAADAGNVVLVCHALTGDQYVAGTHPASGRAGWWSALIGPGKPIDTDRFHVVCTNILGGCAGSTGPASIRAGGEGSYGLSFPVLTIADMVRAQAQALRVLGIERLAAVVGGSMGGMQALEWAAMQPLPVDAIAAIATASRHSPQNIAFHEVGRQAVMADPDWREGRYDADGVSPRKGLAVARMAAHVTYLSEAALNRKFGRQLQDRDGVGFGFDADFQVESYLRHQGSTFVDRFDANSYLYITRAMDYFDMAAEAGGRLADRFVGTASRFLVVSFSSDWLYPTTESRRVVQALHAAGAEVSFVEIESDKGHDAFLLEEPEFHAVVSGFMNSLRGTA